MVILTRLPNIGNFFAEIPRARVDLTSYYFLYKQCLHLTLRVLSRGQRITTRQS